MKHLLFLFLFSLSFSFLSAQCWNLVWSDEFDGNSLDLTKWSHQTGGHGWGNDELEYHTDRTDNATVSNGILQIIAQEESFMGNDYTSARLHSINKGDWKYGRFEASLKLPGTQGIWPAFWMLPSDNVYGGWPNSGEIDIMEHVGQAPGLVHGTVHTEAYNHTIGTQVGDNIMNADVLDNHHLYVAEWDENKIDVYLDDTKYFTFTNDGTDNSATWPFDQRFHFILNVAVGGGWPGPPDETTVFPAIMEVDYVRVYQQLDQIPINGLDRVEPSATNVTYSLPDISGATYSWSVPSDVNIVSGQGTSEIVVNWNNIGGLIEATLTTNCGTENISLNVIADPNIFDNHDFEQDLAFWNTRTGGVASADFLITNSDVVQGQKAAHVQVNSIDANPWDVQLSQSGASLVSGVDYTLRFWAKADLDNTDISYAFIHPTNFTWYHGSQITLSDTWQEFTLEFTASVNENVRFNFDLGRVATSYYFDDVTFAKTDILALPIENLSTFFAKKISPEKVALEWRMEQQHTIDYFEIERSANGWNFQKIGRIDKKTGTFTYHFYDNNPFKKANYYRLKKVGTDGKMDYSQVVLVENTNLSNVRLQSNLVENELVILMEDYHPHQVLELFNLNGLSLKKWTFADLGNNLKLNIADLERGMYFLKITGYEPMRFVKY